MSDLKVFIKTKDKLRMMREEKKKELKRLSEERKRNRQNMLNNLTCGKDISGSGVYKIYNEKLNFIYIGSTNNFAKRLCQHVSTRKKFTNKEIEDRNTRFEIIEKIDSKETMLRREGTWIRYYSKTKLNLKNKVYDPYLEYLVSHNRYSDKSLNITVVHKDNTIVFDKEDIDII